MSADTNRYCGPYALGRAAGITTGEAARRIREVSGQRAVMGAAVEHVTLCLSHDPGLSAVENYQRNRGPSVIDWCRSHAPSARWVIVLNDHYIVVRNNRVFDPRHDHGEPIKNYERRLSHVQSAWECADSRFSDSSAASPEIDRTGSPESGDLDPTHTSGRGDFTNQEQPTTMNTEPMPDDVDLENAHRAAKGLPPMTDAEIAASTGANLLEDVHTFIGRFCVFPDSHALAAVTLWAAHAHMIGHFYTTPRLAILSTEAESGKTRVLEILSLLTPESMLCLSPSPATVFRKLAQEQITLLIDEVDTVFTKQGKDDNNEDLRALLNSGYKRGTTIPRCVGPRHEVINFPVFCAVALDGIGDLPDTIMTRSIVIIMNRRAPNEPLQEYRSRRHDPIGHELRDRLSLWAGIVGRAAGEACPVLPEGVIDRRAELWEPLVAIADLAGGDWPRLAREACTSFCVGRERKQSLGVRLLADLRTIFGNAEALHTETILQRLHNGPTHGLEADAPWADLRGKPLGDRGLATILKRYKVKPLKVTIGGQSLQGYRREHLWDAWVRYLSPVPAEAESPEFPESTGSTAAAPVPQVPQVPPMRTPESASNGAAHCGHCRHFKPDTGENGIGTCLHFLVDTFPAPIDCAAFTAMGPLPKDT